MRFGFFECDFVYRFNIFIGMVRNVVILWVNFLFLRFGLLSIWLSKEVIVEKMLE